MRRILNTGGDRGVALVIVLVFALVASITGLAFFAMASYEWKGAADRQLSSEAFYLADGAVEQARGELLLDKNWRGPIPATPLGRGTYTLAAVDTTVNGEARLLLHAEGRVKDGARGVEVLAGVRSVPEALALFAGGNFIANGNLTVDGHIHVNGTGDFGSADIHLKGGTYDDGFTIAPPAVYTGPGAFPTSTYYRVIPYLIPPANKPSARVDRWDRTTAQWVVVDSTELKPYMDWSSTSPNVFEYDFQKHGNSILPFVQIFPTDTGLFRLDQAAGDQSVVIDFGWPSPGTQTVANLKFYDTQTERVLEPTIINTRFVGISEADRVAPCSAFWQGGITSFGSKVTFAPRNCVALIANIMGPDQGQQPNAQGKLGTATDPALTYVTGNVEGLKGDLEVHGVLISLCDINSQGGPDVYHDPSILDCIPQGVLGDTGAGFLQVQEWREVGL